MVDSNTMRKARRVMAWFNIKNMDNAITLVEYYPDYDYDDFNVLFEQYDAWNIDDCINKILCPNPGFTKTQSAIRKIFHNNSKSYSTSLLMSTHGDV